VHARTRPQISRLSLVGAAFVATSAVAVGCVAEVSAPPMADPTAPITPGAPRQPGDPAACDPGNKTLHRLNRSEYDRTVRDLLGVSSTPAPTFPADDTARGFDNNADVLSTSPLLTEKLVAAAEEVAAGLFVGTSVAQTVTVQAEDLEGSVGAASDGVWNLWSTGELTTDIVVDAAGRYRVTVRADQQGAGDEDASMRVSVDGAVVGIVSVTGLDDYSFEVTLQPGTHSVTAAFENDFYDEASGADRNLLVDAFTAHGPLDIGSAGPGAALIPCDVADIGVAACADATLRPLLRRAFRRPVQDVEVAPYTALVQGVVDDGDPFTDGLATAVTAVLLSPNFLFRVELDGLVGDDAAVHRLGEHELASRLSYFLWGTMPDETLLGLADDGTLSRRDVLSRELERLLADPRAQDGLVDALSSQWLDTRALDRVQPDPALYPLPDDVRAAMKRETRLLVQALVAADRPARDLLDVDFTFVNAPLADFYGQPFPEGDALAAADVDGDGFVQVSLQGTNRAGILTQGALLAGHSYPFRTSPVKRGRFVIDSLLCIPPGDIPADVPPLDETATGSVRERMEQHRQDPRCAACHDMMDPIGFGLEGFDPVGKARTEDADGYVIDDSDVFFGAAFSGPAGLASVLKEQETLSYCMAERIGGLGLGRGLDYSVAGDTCTIQDVVLRSTEQGASWQDLLRTIVQTDAFQMRRARTASDDDHLTTADQAADSQGD
jgi:hypothetical protein